MLDYSPYFKSLLNVLGAPAFSDPHGRLPWHFTATLFIVDHNLL